MAKATPQQPTLSNADYHILLVLAEHELYGYAIMKAVEADSGGTVTLGIGSLYRMLARLAGEGLVAEVADPPDAPAEHRGRSRRYYGITRLGRRALRAESERLEDVLRLARERNVFPQAAR